MAGPHAENAHGALTVVVVALMRFSEHLVHEPVPSVDASRIASGKTALRRLKCRRCGKDSLFMRHRSRCRVEADETPVPDSLPGAAGGALAEAGVAVHKRFSSKGSRAPSGHASVQHASLKTFTCRFRGVSTRRPPNYLVWFEWARGARRADGRPSSLLRAQMEGGTYVYTLSRSAISARRYVSCRRRCPKRATTAVANWAWSSRFASFVDSSWW